MHKDCFFLKKKKKSINIIVLKRSIQKNSQIIRHKYYWLVIDDKCRVNG
jgi:hypothetical protein